MQTKSSKQTKAEKSKSLSVRQLRTGELIRHILAEIFSRGALPAFEQESTSITVSEVRMSPDLRRATCFVLPLGGKRCDATLEELRKSNSWLNAKVAGKIRLKFAPKLVFCIDPSFDEARRIETLLQSKTVNRDLEKKHTEDDVSEE